MKQSDKLLHFLNSVLGPYKTYTNSETYFKCPFCSNKDNKKKLAINLDPDDREKFQRWHCWRDDFHRGSNLVSLVKKMKLNDSRLSELKSILKSYGITYDINTIESELFKKKETVSFNEISLPKEFISFTECNSTDQEFRNALSYLLKRKVTRDDIIKNNMGFCPSGPFGGYIIIPSYTDDMKVNYFIARAYYENNTFRYKNPPASKNVVFNEIHIAWSLPIVLCEGVFDSLAIKRNSIPLLGKTVGDALRTKIIEKRVKDVYLCLDKDAMKNSITYIEEFMRNGISVYFVDLPQSDSSKKDDPSTLGFEKMCQLIKLATKVEFSDLIKFKLSF